MKKKVKKIILNNWGKFGFEFFLIFIAVIAAFSLNNWNENRKSDNSENKILIEIFNGLEKDLEDIKQNKLGHKYGISACNYFRKALYDKSLSQDSLKIYYNAITRDFISIQNTAAYETLKSRGLELIKNDSLRFKIITLYEFDYQILRKLEEEYSEMQFHENYFKEINKSLAPNFNFNDEYIITGIKLPLKISNRNKKIFLLYLVKIQGNRSYIMSYYNQIEKKVFEVKEEIKKEIKR
ncbi:DUF6090 family protein [Tenacibaculum sp. C7A-26P2]|uniref:DUF6090 family protein n=1 Tax=Tenacibaculum sp. C7A-26P2 TaxID=3447504 RepID=UPI003F832375